MSQAVRDDHCCADPSGQILQNMSHDHSMAPPYPVSRGNRRIRQVPTAIEPRQQTQILAGGFAATPNSALMFSRTRQQDRNILGSDSMLPILGDPFAFQLQLSAISNQEAFRHQDQTSAALVNSMRSQGNAPYQKPFFPVSPLGETLDGLGSGSLASRFSPGIGFETSRLLGVADILDQRIMAESSLPSHMPGSAVAVGDYLLGLPRSDSTVQSWSERNDFPMYDTRTGCQDLIRGLIAARSARPVCTASNEKSIQDSEWSVAQDSHCKELKGIASPQEQICRDGFLSGSRDPATQEMASNQKADFRRQYITKQVGQDHALSKARIEHSQESLKLHAPIRFFNSGVEISMNGRPLTETEKIVGKNAVSKPKGKMIDGQRTIETSDYGRRQELKTLQERQQSIWAAFSLDDANDLHRMENDETIDSRQAVINYENCSSETAIHRNGYSESDRRGVKYSSKDSESTLIAAGVLMALSPQTPGCIRIDVKNKMSGR